MQYYDPLESDVVPELDEKTPVKVKDIHGTAPNNDGDRYLWENGEASGAGFNKDNNIDIVGSDETPQWFAFDVTVTREKISPGIKKTVAEPMIPTDKSADWTVTSFNNSATELSGYKITDTLDLPLQFEGKFSYSLYGSSRTGGADEWYVSAKDYLFNITRNGENSVTIISNTNESKELTIGENNKVELNIRTVCYKNQDSDDVTAKIKVQISHDTDNHEVLIIDFSDPKWGIIPNGYSVLKFSTPLSEEEKDKSISAVYTNTAMFSPNDKNYDDRITQGKLVRDKDGNNVGVEHSAVVSIYTGSPSGSIKMIEEKGDKTNFTTSEREDNYIRLMHKEDVFTYTLEVRNLGDTSMGNLVIIDNLPQIGDQTTLRQESKRESEFQVDLAKDSSGTINSDVQVWLYEPGVLDSSGLDRSKVSPANYSESIKHEVLEPNKDYTVEYSEKQKDFNENDWTCVNDTDSKWSETPSDGTRSIRIHFNKQIKAGEVIQIRFDAQIDGSDKDAQPGRIAWNTFGYSYKVNNLTAKASPNKVGICIPGSPTLTKKVVDFSGKESKVPEKTTFGFIIYKNNNPVSFKDYTEKTVAKTLNDANIDFMYKELTVDANQSESNKVYLDKFIKYDYTGDENFSKFDEPTDKTGDFWDENSNYYVVELATNENFSYQSTNGNTTNNYRFKVDPIRNTPLEFVNENLQAPVELPETGGNGTGMFVFGGLMMICLSAFFLVRNRRKRTQR